MANNTTSSRQIEYALYRLFHDILSTLLCILAPILSIILVTLALYREYNQVTLGGTVVSVYNPHSSVVYLISRIYQYLCPLLAIIMASRGYDSLFDHGFTRVVNTHPDGRGQIIVSHGMAIIVIVLSSFVAFASVMLTLCIANHFFPLLDLFAYSFVGSDIVFYAKVTIATVFVYVSQALLNSITRSSAISILIGCIAVWVFQWCGTSFWTPYTGSLWAYKTYIQGTGLAVKDLELLIIPFCLVLIYYIIGAITRRKTI